MQNHFGLFDTDVMPMFMIIALDVFIIMRFSINCSAVICSPTIIHAISREATRETYGPWVSFPLYCISFLYCWILFTILQSLLSSLYNKNTKNIYFIISITSHFCEWPWRDWQPLYCVGCKFLIVCAGIWWLVRRLLLDWYLGSQNWGKYLRYFAASPFPLQGKTNASSRGSKKDFWHRCRGGLRQIKPYQVPIINSSPLHYIICHSPLVFLSPTSIMILENLCLFFALLLFDLIFACVSMCLLCACIFAC